MQTMEIGKGYRKNIAWMLITALVNPAAVTPALARDTDIFLNPATNATAAELKGIGAAVARGHPSIGAVTIPISALNRAESSSDVYLGFFQPDRLERADGFQSLIQPRRGKAR